MKAPESDRVGDPPVPDTTETLITGAVQSILTVPLAKHRATPVEFGTAVSMTNTVKLLLPSARVAVSPS